jgi:hypothetical protein
VDPGPVDSWFKITDPDPLIYQRFKELQKKGNNFIIFYDLPPLI